MYVHIYMYICVNTKMCMITYSADLLLLDEPTNHLDASYMYIYTHICMYKYVYICIYIYVNTKMCINTYSADLLLLDEPTNHLDATSIEWLAAYLHTLTNTTVSVYN